MAKLGVSLRAYAAHRKCSLAAVQKAIAAERISLLADGSIDAAAADAQWAANTNQSQQRGRHAEAPAPPPPPKRPAGAAPAKKRPPAATIDEDLDVDAPPVNTAGTMYAKARAAREGFAARLMQNRLRKEIGEVVEAADVEEGWSRIVLAAKTGVLAIPTKAKTRIPHLTSADIATLEEIVREVLTVLADGNK